jgi:hypothetical protein
VKALAVLFVAGAIAVPWKHPLAFRSLPGWTSGQSGTVRSAYTPRDGYIRVPVESTAWMARGVRYRDPATADPPNRTLAQLPPDGIVVWAVIYEGGNTSSKRIDLRVSNARHYLCCEGEPVAGGEYELDGRGPIAGTAMIVRVYFGSHPTAALRAAAQRALDRLALD